MNITWHGHACFRVDCAEGSAVFDPYAPGSVPGCGPLALAADAVYCSHDHPDHNHVQSVRLSGRAGPRVEALPCWHDECGGAKRGENLVHILHGDGLRLAHLGDLGHEPDGALLEALRGVDVLLVPVGGFYTIGPREAAALIAAVRPRIAVPMHYRLGGMGFPVIAELSDFTALCENVVRYKGNFLAAASDTPAQTAVLRYVG